MEKKQTGYNDKNGSPIKEGDTLLHETIDGGKGEFVVRWSDYRKNWIGDDPREIYDLSVTNFPNATIKQS